MSVNLCVHFYVIAAVDGERATEVARIASRASDELFYGRGPGRQEAWDRAVAVQLAAYREISVEQHRFRLPHGEKCCSELGSRVCEARKLPFELYGVLSPAQLREFRVALEAVAEKGDAQLIASLPETCRTPETAAQFLTMLRHVLERAGGSCFLAIQYEDGVWDDPPDEPIEPGVESEDSLDERLARIDQAVTDGRVTKRERAALVSAMKQVSKSADRIAALLDLAEILNAIEAKLSCD